MHYRLRAEWAPQRGVFLVWPHKESDWHDTLSQIQPWYARFVAAVSPTEAVYILCHNEQTERDCYRYLEQHTLNRNHVHTLIVPSNDTWIRDFAPLSLASLDTATEPEIIWANFRFNAWGGKYDYELDNQAAKFLSQLPLAQQTIHYDWILEGGAIDINDDGILITTANCVLNTNRNAYDRQQMESRLREDLGASQVVILDAGFLQGDDTDSHVDNLVRFSDNQTLLYCSCDNQDDVHFTALQAMQQQLEQWNSTLVKPLTLIPIPLPAPVYNAEGERLAASYLNFLILNHVVVVPTYHDNANEKALVEKFESLFPHRSIVTIASRDLVVQGGGPHCATMQFS